GTVAGGNGVFKGGVSGFPTGSFRNTNYWVDVVFAETTVDSNPLTITNINVQVLDGSNAIVTWATSKDATSRIDYSSDPSLPSTPSGTQTVVDNALVSQHSMHLTGLIPRSTYYFNITAIDKNGNP